MSDGVVKLAYELCNISSITGFEQEVVAFLEQYFVKEGLLVEKYPVTKERANLFISAKKRSHYTAILCTHIDTVAPFIKPQIDQEQGILWGRGSIDAKGIAASMIKAFLWDYHNGHDDIALLFTVGEEESSDGAKVANEELKAVAKYIIIGEPTELKAARAQKGSLVFDLKARGISAHSALPHLGDCAIKKLIKTAHNLLDYKWPLDPIYGETLINIGTIEGGEMRNMLAPYASLQAIMRLSKNTQEIKKILSELIVDDVEIIIHSECNPFSYATAQGFDTFIAGFGSDAPYLFKLGKPMLIGPGSLSLAHTDKEHICFGQLEDGVLAYKKIIENLRSS